MAKESKSVNDVSPEQINQWILEHQNNENTDAQDKLVRHYKKLIESLAYKYSKGQSHHEDLVQVGMVGLIGAINRFDLSFDRKFEAFLVPTVIGEIKRYLRDKTWSVHVPRRIKEIGPRIKKVTDELTNKYSKGQSHHEDLVQVGMVGLIGAINRFDLSFDRKFEAFLVPTVIGEIKRYLRDKTWSVHVPRRIKEIGPRIKKVTDELTN